MGARTNVQRMGVVVGAVVSVLSLYFFASRLMTHYSAASKISAGSLVVVLGVGVAIYLAAVACTTICWHCYVNGFEDTDSLRTTAQIYLISQFAKYLPGNVGQYLGRFALSRAAGISATTVLAVMVLETISAIWMSFALGLTAGVKTKWMEFASLGVGKTEAMGAGLLLIGALVALPAMLIGLERLKGRLRLLRNLKVPTVRLIAAGGGLFCAAFLLFAGIVMELASLGYGVKGAFSLSVVGIVAWSWLAGFLVPGAPAGLGVREALLTLGLGSVYGEPVALGVVVLFRVVTTVGDGVALLAGLALRHLGVKPSVSPAGPPKPQELMSR